MTKINFNTKEIFKNSFKNIYDSFIYLLFFQLIFKGIIFILFKPILKTIISLFIKPQGYGILVNGEIDKVLFSFSGVIMFLILMTTSILLIYYEFTVMLLIIKRTKNKEKIELVEINKTALLKFKKMLKIKNIGLSLYILFLIPFLNIGIQSSILSTKSIPSFITGQLTKYPGSEILFYFLGFIKEELLNSPASKVLLLILVLVLVYLFSKLFIVLPTMIFEDKSFIESSKISFKTMTGERFKFTLVTILFILLWLMANYFPLNYQPSMMLESSSFILVKIVKGIFNVTMTIFSLFVSSFILSMNFEDYSSYCKSKLENSEETEEKLELNFFGRLFKKLLRIIFAPLQGLIGKIKNNKKPSIALVLILIVVLTIFSERTIRPIYDDQLILGHRGGDYGVENTVDILVFAGTSGADYSETDTMLTKDNIPVIIHDNSLKRLGDIPQKISDMTIEEVMAVRIETGGKEDKIPSLEELARKVKGKTKLLLEFKIHGKEKESIVDKTIEILEKEGILEDTIFQTSEHEVIKEFNEKHQDLSIGYVILEKLGNFSSRKISKIPVDFISAEESLIDKKMIKEVHKARKGVFAWTINDYYKSERLLEMGIDGIITDFPVEMSPIREKYRKYY